MRDLCHKCGHKVDVSHISNLAYKMRYPGMPDVIDLLVCPDCGRMEVRFKKEKGAKSLLFLAFKLYHKLKRLF